MEKKKEKDSEEIKNDKSKEKSDDGKGDDNIKALQRKLSKKDEEMKSLQKELDEKKSSDDSEIATLTKTVESLTGEITKITTGKRREDLAEKYPDIHPDLLMNVDENNLEEVVENQRAISKEKFGDAQFFQQPKYNSIEDIDKKIKGIQEDKGMNGIDKAALTLDLENEKNNFTEN